MTKLCSAFFNIKKTENWLSKVMHSFEVHSNESACRKISVLGWNKSNASVSAMVSYITDGTDQLI